MEVFVLFYGFYMCKYFILKFDRYIGNWGLFLLSGGFVYVFVYCLFGIFVFRIYR